MPPAQRRRGRALVVIVAWGAALAGLAGRGRVGRSDLVQAR